MLAVRFKDIYQNRGRRKSKEFIVVRFHWSKFRQPFDNWTLRLHNWIYLITLQLVLSGCKIPNR